MILEGLVTTTDTAGAMHLAPMGPRMADDGKTFLLRPFNTSQTFQNLKRHGEGVLHVTDDVLLLAKAAVGKALPPATRPARKVDGFVMTDGCRAMEFVVRSLDETEERVRIECEIVHAETMRDFFGFNRAKHAVLEAAILATRLHLIPIEEIRAEFRKLRVLVDKTGGPAEQAAFDFLEAHAASA